MAKISRIGDKNIKSAFYYHGYLAQGYKILKKLGKL
jgi:hypothetical protein